MSIQIVPTADGADTPIYEQPTTLDGVPFTLYFAFSSREACWYLSVATSDGTDIANGMKLVCKWDLLSECVDPARPAGKLVVTSNTSDSSPPGLSDLAPGGRCVLQYASAADVAAILAGTFSAS